MEQVVLQMFGEIVTKRPDFQFETLPSKGHDNWWWQSFVNILGPYKIGYIFAWLN